MSLEAFARDVRYALRGLLRNPLFTIVAVLTLAIGTAANTAVFSVVDGVLLKPLPYPHPDELAAVWHDAPGAPGLSAVAAGLQISPSMLVTYREHNHTFQSVGLWVPGAASVTGLGEPEQVPAVLVTGDLLPTLGIPPRLGRWITEQDEKPGAPPVTVLGYRYWQARFGGDPNVIGKTITIASTTAEIVGVMPRGFRIGDTAADLIGPYPIDRTRLVPPPFCCFGVARLKPGVTLDEANADIERMLPIWLESFPFPGRGNAREVYLDTWRIAPALRPLKADVLGNVGDVLWVVMATIGIVLVIACANVSNLLLVRGERRKQEIAVRAALGAGSWRIARVQLLESVLLALAGGAAGVAVAYGALALLLRLAPPGLPRLDAIELDARALAFTLVVTVIAGGVLGLAPALKAARTRISTAVRGGGRGALTSRSQHRVQNVLVVGQVALALVLLVGSGLMIRTFESLRSVEPGFTEPETLQTFRVELPVQLVPDAREVTRQQHAILDALGALPGVSSAAFITGLPMERAGSNWDDLDVEGRPTINTALRTFRGVSPGYFRTMGTRLVAGRDIEWSDIEQTRPVALVSEALARELWQEPAAAVGKRVRAAGGNGPWREIVGVVEDVRANGLDEPPPSTVYWPALMADFYRDQPFFVYRGVAFAVRSDRAGSAPFVREIEQAIWAVNPSLPLAGVRTMQSLFDASLARTSFTLVMLALAAGAALVLGVIGLYGVLSYAVSQRRREIALRLALGAQQATVARHFMRHGVSLAVIGVALGLLAAAGVTRLMASLLYAVEPIDTPTYAAVAGLLTAIAALASYVPARRASAVDPAEALADE